MTAQPATAARAADSPRDALHRILAEGPAPARNYAEAMERAVRQTKRSGGAIAKEIARLGFAGHKIGVAEYFDFALFRDDIPFEEKARFIGQRASMKLWREFYRNNAMFMILHDKILCGAMLDGLGFPSVRPAALYRPGAGARHVPTLGNTEALTAFLRDSAGRALFGKPLDSLQSRGCLALDIGDDGVVTINGTVELSAEDVAATIAERYQGGYLFEERLAVHPDFVPLSGERFPTTRVMTGAIDGKAEILAVAQKLTGSGNVADNFWRNGNLIVDIDPEDGTMRRAVTGRAFDTRALERHPASDAALTGVKLPGWEAISALALEAQTALSGIAVIGWDIGLTAEGPIIVEANQVPSMMMFQYPRRAGFPDARMTSFLDRLRASRERRRAA